MKKFVTLCIATLIIAVSAPANAGGWDDRGRHGWENRHRHGHHARHERHEHHRHHGYRSNAWAWGAAGLALGGAIVSIQANRPAPVVMAQPVQPRFWYFCESFQAYYPQVQHCPEPWQTVPAW